MEPLVCIDSCLVLEACFTIVIVEMFCAVACSGLALWRLVDGKGSVIVERCPMQCLVFHFSWWLQIGIDHPIVQYIILLHNLLTGWAVYIMHKALKTYEYPYLLLHMFYQGVSAFTAMKCDSTC